MKIACPKCGAAFPLTLEPAQPPFGYLCLPLHRPDRELAEHDKDSEADPLCPASHQLVPIEK